MNDNERLKKDYDYYTKNHNEIIKKYLNKFIIIKDEKIVDSYDTFEEAFQKSSEKYKLGTFIIQKCTENIEEDTQIFHSRVIW